jgi:hypothetical protein
MLSGREKMGLAPSRWALVAAVLLTSGGLASTALAQRPWHYFQSGDMVPGAVGTAQLLRGGPLPGYFQPVEVQVPIGAAVSLSIGGTFEPPQPESVMAGMLIGQVYRLKVTNIPRNEGFEVFPTVEIINRLYPPRGLENHFPIPIDITAEELEMALAGQFVTRVIYLEDPNNAMPRASDPRRQMNFEVRADDDPLEVADRLGRPMAILRMGSRVPTEVGPGGFDYGMPPLVKLKRPAPLPDAKSGLEPVEPLPPGTQGRAIPRIPLPRAYGLSTDARPAQWAPPPAVWTR